MNVQITAPHDDHSHVLTRRPREELLPDCRPSPNHPKAFPLLLRLILASYLLVVLRT